MSVLSGKVDYIDPAKTNVRCIALAPPPVYRSSSKLPKDLKTKIEIFINNNDCVPRLSLGVVAKLLAMMKAVDSLPISKFEQLQLLSGNICSILLITNVILVTDIIFRVTKVANSKWFDSSKLTNRT